MNDRKTALADKTVLVADDDVEILGLVTRHLSSYQGARILEASDGEEALRTVRRERPDLVILDVMMPGMTGWEVCRAIREDEALRATGVIMLTGIGERLNEMTSPLYGADEYLDKPFEFEDLDDRITAVASKR
ncbi:MAG: response regulator [Sandaracinaceae bacterium]|nr:response regulator [Sandaracinaceae bacterium]